LSSKVRDRSGKLVEVLFQPNNCANWITKTVTFEIEKQFNTAVLVLSIWYKTTLGIKQMPTH